MLITVWLILGAMSFGAMMDYGGFNSRLITPVIGRLKSAGGSIAGVMVTALGLNIVAGDQYIAIVLPARMFMVEFRKRGLHPRDPGDGGGKLWHGHLSVDPLELLRRLHVGCAGCIHLRLFTLLFLQFCKLPAGNDLTDSLALTSCAWNQINNPTRRPSLKPPWLI